MDGVNSPRGFWIVKMHRKTLALARARYGARVTLRYNESGDRDCPAMLRVVTARGGRCQVHATWWAGQALGPAAMIGLHRVAQEGLTLGQDALYEQTLERMRSVRLFK